MRSIILPSVFGVVLAFGVGQSAPAADKQNTSVTGCLQKQGDKSGEFSIVDADGKKYGLKSSQVKLEDHLTFLDEGYLFEFKFDTSRQHFAFSDPKAERRGRQQRL